MANTGFVVNTHRIDPHKNFKFRVLWDGKAVLGVSKVGTLKRTTEVVKHRSGGDNSHESLKIEPVGWLRDTETTEPDESA